MSFHLERLSEPSVGVVSSYELGQHARADHFDDLGALEDMADAAAADFEATFNVALLEQALRETRDSWPDGDVWRLAVVPVLADAPVTVTAGGAPFDAFHIIRGTRPALILTMAPPPGRLIATYTAGWPTAAAIPRDVRHGIIDQAALMFDARGASDERVRTMSPSYARAAARLRRVAI